MNMVLDLESSTNSSQVSLSEPCGNENSTSLQLDKEYSTLETTKTEAQSLIYSELNILDGATMEGVVVSKEATNFTSQNRKSQGTRLVSINSISLKDITVGSLRTFCTRTGLKGPRKLPKMFVIVGSN